MQILICIAIVFVPPALVFIGAGIYSIFRSRQQQEHVRNEFHRVRQMPELLVHRV